ncbi:MAG: lysine--tRNA ligase [Candidatus Dormibacteria bacterium]
MADEVIERPARPEGGLAELRRQRLVNLQTMRDQGVEPYALNYDRTHSVAAARADFQRAGDAPDARTGPVRLAGRVTRHRPQGKVGFADLADESGQIQLMARADTLGEAGHALFKMVDLGDIVGAEGHVIRSRSGEVTLELTGLQMLTKALRPLPDKWHGLKDPELRFRQRHIDLIVNPDSRRMLAVRSRTITALRRFLDGRGFQEVETPMLHRVAGGAAARPFLTHHNTLDLDLKLRIAVELHHKRLLIGGLERIYEIGRAFRNEGIDAQHNPEFTILEAYQAYSDLEGMAELTESLVKAAAAEVLGDGAVEHQHQGQTIDLAAPWVRAEMLDLIHEKNPGLDLADDEQLRAHASDLGAVPRARDWGELIYEIFERSVEKTLVQPTLVMGFPVSVSPLARRRRDDPRLAERFELFIAGGEYANAFSELTDPLDQRSRFEQQLQAQAAGDEETHPMDEDFIAALEQGMPPAGGVGMGVDRLVMLLAGAAHIREVLAFPLMRDRPTAPADCPEEA